MILTGRRWFLWHYCKRSTSFTKRMWRCSVESMFDPGDQNSWAITHGIDHETDFFLISETLERFSHRSSQNRWYGDGSWGYFQQFPYSYAWVSLLRVAICQKNSWAMSLGIGAQMSNIQDYWYFFLPVLPKRFSQLACWIIYPSILSIVLTVFPSWHLDLHQNPWYTHMLFCWKYNMIFKQLNQNWKSCWSMNCTRN